MVDNGTQVTVPKNRPEEGLVEVRRVRVVTEVAVVDLIPQIPGLLVGEVLRENPVDLIGHRGVGGLEALQQALGLVPITEVEERERSQNRQVRNELRRLEVRCLDREHEAERLVQVALEELRPTTLEEATWPELAVTRHLTVVGVGVVEALEAVVDPCDVERREVLEILDLACRLRGADGLRLGDR